MARGQTLEELHNFDMKHPYKEEHTSSDADDVKHKWKKGRVKKTGFCKMIKIVDWNVKLTTSYTDASNERQWGRHCKRH
jgi:hypothetical protein